MTQDFITSLNNFVNVAQSTINEHFKNFGYSNPPVLEIDGGNKYVKIVEVRHGSVGKSVYGFVEKSTGNILKAASWRAPAKHSRGNIYDADGGASACTPWGIKYLK